MYEVIRLEIANPAASSPAELILSPVDRRSIAVAIVRSFFVSALAVIVAAVLVLITVIVLSSFVTIKVPPNEWWRSCPVANLNRQEQKKL
jgi:hypothetical protein